ncbi:phosphoglycolate phosphatase [Rhodovulum adriaticum]|uniref:Phosphoglycolate phosphatase n=1 Tax=Rhodovulum adriaticum TaxID=35804 RepID=A0A4V2SLE9_RHOAD|nr:phosphoglycolate phosphatase [Rhodovulum adriaticum]MBK1634494.1 phosphoglycolate phosphatase [Rhodovulum adriaticum]TCP23136.1 phosphoglycolate phosphatase [Rhodovulum adriaticum]
MKAIIFDLDGTLIDSAPDIHAAVNKTLAETGDGELDLDTVRDFIGNGVHVLIERVIAARGLSADRHPAMLESFLKHYEADPATLTTLFPGVQDCVESLHDEGFALGLCTNKPEGPSRAILQAFGLDKYFGAVVGGDTVGTKKPDPAPLLAVKDKLGARVAVYIGDSEIDGECAQRAGMKFALFTEGYRHKGLHEIPHEARFDDFDVLSAIAGRLAEENR